MTEIKLDDKLKATKPQQVFQFKDWIVLINDANLFTGIRMNSTYSEVEVLKDLRGIDLTSIKEVLSFKENFGGDHW